MRALEAVLEDVIKFLGKVSLQKILTVSNN